MISILNVVLAILEAIPILDKWFKEMSLLYAQKKVEKGDEDFAKAMDQATTLKTTKDLQAIVGGKLHD